MLYQLYLHISKTRNLLLFVINITNRNTILNFNKLVSDLDIETDSWDGKDSKFCYLPMGHIVTGNVKIITDLLIRSVISKGPKYRFQAHIDFNKCRNTIASDLNDYCTRWCKREHVESNALNNWKLKILRSLMNVCYFTLITLIFSLQSLNYLFDIWNEVSKNFIGSMFWLQLIKLAANNFVVAWRLYYINTLIQELGSTKTYERISTDERSVANTHSIDITAKFAVSIKEKQDRLSSLYWLPKLHKRPYKARFIANSS